jgi:FAD/FMN-containing dehydrogenase
VVNPVAAQPPGRTPVRRTPDPAAWADLRAEVAGEVVLPGDPGYDAVRGAADPRFRFARPRGVVRCAGPADVRAALAFARRHRLTPHPRSGGHCRLGSSTGPGLVVDVSALDAVEVDGDTARVGAGARSGAVARVLADHGRMLPLGASPHAGIAGAALGGGMGAVGRRYGLTLDNLVGAEVVLADGRTVECGPDSHTELLWALRGAGAGNFGVVTRFTFRTYPAPRVHAFVLGWPLEHAAEVVSAWQSWALTLPDRLSSQVAVRPAHGDAVVGGAWLGSADEAAPLLARLSGAVGRPPAATGTTTGGHPDAVDFLWERLAPAPGPGGPCVFRRGDLLGRPLPPEAVGPMVRRIAGGTPAAGVPFLTIVHLGGACGGDPATAWAHRACLFDVRYSAAPAPGAGIADAVAARDWLAGVEAELRPWTSGGCAPDRPAATRADWARSHYGDRLRRLRRAKDVYDPDRLFRRVQGL